MVLEENKLYHIFNQGNNRQKIFFCRENYLFFLKKINLHILPHADILAWCLMPNHFHLMIYVHTLAVSVSGESGSKLMTNQVRNLNNSVGLILRTYTRAINKKENRSGSLFKTHTHAEPVEVPSEIIPSFLYSLNLVDRANLAAGIYYPQVCFNYIHNNPVKAKLAQHPSDWEYSSFCDYAGLRNGKLINKDRAVALGLHWG